MLARPPTTIPDPPNLEDEAPAGSPWLSHTLGRLLEHVRALVPVDGAAFLVLDAARTTLRPVAGWFASAELREGIGAASERPYDPARAALPELVIERGRALLLPRLEAWEAAVDLRGALADSLGAGRVERIWDVYRRASVIACPVKSAAGQPLGVLVVASLEPERPLGVQELRTIEVMASVSALAMERAELLDREGRRAREELLLKRASEAISASLEPEEVYARIVEHALRLTGATKALLTRLDSRASELRVVESVDFSESITRRRLRLGRGMLGEVARTREPYLSRPADAGRFDNGLLEEERVGSFMHAPIELGPRLFGVLSVAHEQEGRFTGDDLSLLVRVARSSAAAIANAIDFQRERRIAQALALGFVPESLPDVPWYEVGLLYRPARNEPTGGDIYGAWRLPGGEVAVLVGDVAGKGVETAALSAMVRFFVEARSWDSSRPSVVLEQANAMLMTRLPADTFVTEFLVVLTDDRLRYCNAGHLPPLLVSPRGRSELGGHGLPLGIDDSTGYREDELSLGSEDLVFAFTDGLLEARRGEEVYGLDRLAALAADRSRRLAPQELVRSVHDEVAAWAAGLGDDAVAMALRRRRG